jgi:hypothetical protein
VFVIAAVSGIWRIQVHDRSNVIVAVNACTPISPFYQHGLKTLMYGLKPVTQSLECSGQPIAMAFIGNTGLKARAAHFGTPRRHYQVIEPVRPFHGRQSTVFGVGKIPEALEAIAADKLKFEGFNQLGGTILDNLKKIHQLGVEII